MRAVLVTMAAAIVVALAPSAVHADPVPDVPGGIYVKRISPAPAGPAITVTLSNGRTDQLRPCVYEDGRRCYWQADRVGNGRGNDFLVMSGIVFHVDLSWIGGSR